MHWVLWLLHHVIDQYEVIDYMQIIGLLLFQQKLAAGSPIADGSDDNSRFFHFWKDLSGKLAFFAIVLWNF